jgi:hypothetical protein
LVMRSSAMALGLAPSASSAEATRVVARRMRQISCPFGTRTAPT